MMWGLILKEKEKRRGEKENNETSIHFFLLSKWRGNIASHLTPLPTHSPTLMPSLPKGIVPFQTMKPYKSFLPLGASSHVFGYRKEKSNHYTLSNLSLFSWWRGMHDDANITKQLWDG